MSLKFGTVFNLINIILINLSFITFNTNFIQFCWDLKKNEWDYFQFHILF